MKHPSTLALLLIAPLQIAAQTWTQKANFGTPGSERWQAVSFSINGKGYLGTGQTMSGIRRDFWEYDPVTDSWTQKADLGLDFYDGRQMAVGFTIGSLGYVGLGRDPGSTYKNDLWEFDPNTNIWIRKADFPGGARMGAVGFTIADKAYVGTGFNGTNPYFSDFWEYNPSSNSWTMKAGFAGGDRTYAAGFSISGKGYVGTGMAWGNCYNDFWEYNPSTNSWTTKAAVGSTTRRDAVGLSIGSLGYIGTGLSGSFANLKDYWEYNPLTNVWTQKLDFGGSARYDASAFTIGTCGYVGAGYSGSYTRDIWATCPVVQPIGLISFSGFNTNGGVHLNWVSPSLSGQEIFTVERSSDAKNFEAIATSPVNENSDQEYFYDDPAPFAGVFYYRLRITYGDQENISDVLEVFTGNDMAFRLGEIFPNPASDRMQCTVTCAVGGLIEVNIMDLYGKSCATQTLTVREGTNAVSLPVNLLRTGIYMMHVRDEENNLLSGKFMKQ